MSALNSHISQYYILFAGVQDSPTSVASRVIFLFWILFSFLILAHYNSFLISSLTVQKPYLPIRGFNDLYAKKDQFQVAIVGNASDEQFLKVIVDY